MYYTIMCFIFSITINDINGTILISGFILIYHK